MEEHLNVESTTLNSVLLSEQMSIFKSMSTDRLVVESRELMDALMTAQTEGEHKRISRRIELVRNELIYRLMVSNEETNEDGSED